MDFVAYQSSMLPLFKQHIILGCLKNIKNDYNILYYIPNDNKNVLYKQPLKHTPNIIWGISDFFMETSQN
jgi:hypothetical protein